MVKYMRRWTVGAMFALTLTGGSTAAFANPAGTDGTGNDPVVATGEPPVPMGGAPTTTTVIVATDDPPVPPVVATGPPPTPPAVTNVSPRNPGNVVLPETGAQAQVGLALIATLLIGAGVGLRQAAARQRLTPLPVRIHHNR